MKENKQSLKEMWDIFKCTNVHILRVPEGEEEKKRSKTNIRASLVAQWLRVCLPVQGTRVQALVWEDPTCSGATRPVSHSY